MSRRLAAERNECLASAFEICVLEELDEGQTHGVHEGRYHAKAEVDAMTEEQDEKHRQPTYEPWQRGGQVGGELIEDSAEDTARETEGEEADVAQEVAKQSCGHAIDTPHTAAKVDEDVLVGVVVEHDAQGCYAYDCIEDVLQELRQCHATGWKEEEQGGRQQGRYP